MTTEVAPWNDEGSEVSDVESWSEADPAMLLETLIASDDENNYQGVFDLLSHWGQQNSDLLLYIDHPNSAERIVDALKTKSLEDFKVALLEYDADLLLLSECGEIEEGLIECLWLPLVRKLAGPGFAVTHQSHYASIVRRSCTSKCPMLA